VTKVILKNIDKSFPNLNGKKSQNQISTKDHADQQTDQSSVIHILRSIDLTIEDGEFMVLVGPSGCGKSTLLRLVAGLETLTNGEIWLGDRLINDLPPKKRDIAMVFQNYALYPHLNVYDNLAFGLRRMLKNNHLSTENKHIWLKNLSQKILGAITRPLPRKLRYLSAQEKIIRQKVYHCAQLLQIEALLNRLPKELSGGQKQRVALGRAISRDPQVFLMDEPLSNLDAKLRGDTRNQIVQLQRQLNTTTLYVTHDQTEAMTMGDRIAVMNKGEILQIAPPLEIYHYPNSRFVAEFIGSPPMNFLEVIVENDCLIIDQNFQVKMDSQTKEKLNNYQNQSILLGIRPEHLILNTLENSHIKVIVEVVEALGNETYLFVHLAGNSEVKLKVRIAPDYIVKKDDIISLSLVIDKLHLFDLYTEKRI
jgi:multiple sugar transport system ATP-binding protein